MTVTLAIPPCMEKLGARYWSRSQGSQKQPDDMMMVAAGQKKWNRPQWKRKETMERVSCRSLNIWQSKLGMGNVGDS